MSHLRVNPEDRDPAVVGEKDRDLAAFTDDMASRGNQVCRDGKPRAFATQIAGSSGSLNDDQGFLDGSRKVLNPDCGRRNGLNGCICG